MYVVHPFQSRAIGAENDRHPCSSFICFLVSFAHSKLSIFLVRSLHSMQGKNRLGEGPTRARAQLFCGTEDNGDRSESELSDTMNSVMDDMELALRDLNTLDQGTSSLLHSSPR